LGLIIVLYIEAMSLLRTQGLLHRCWVLIGLVAWAVQAAPEAAVLQLHSPADLSGKYAAFFATFSGFPLPKGGDLQVWAPKEEVGCYQYEDAPQPGFVSIVMRGNCTFIDKAENAEKAGAVGIIVVSTTGTVRIMNAGNGTNATVGIFSVSVAEEFGEKLRKASLAAQSEARELPTLSITAYSVSFMDFSEGLLILMATTLVALGAFFSTTDMVDVHPSGSLSTALAAPQEEVLEVNSHMAFAFCFMGSCVLVFLFFFMKYAIYFIIFAFCVGGATTITQIGGIILAHHAPSLKTRVRALDDLCGPVTRADMFAAIPAGIVVISWLLLRNTSRGWIFQDIIGAGFLCQIQRTLRLPDIKTATLLLSAMFFFDIFWVFISPLFFRGESVMVEVATGGGTGESVPMLLRMPSFGDGPFGSDRLLGFGDIALPGLLVSYLRRHDLMSKRGGCRGYFVPALIGYFIGLNVTIFALMMMRMGQPALLYLVPGTLGTTLVLARCRGELGLLWEGEPANDYSSSSEENTECAGGDYGRA